MSSTAIDPIDEFFLLDLSEIVAKTFVSQTARPSDTIARVFGSAPRVPTTPDHRWDDETDDLPLWSTV